MIARVLMGALLAGGCALGQMQVYQVHHPDETETLMNPANGIDLGTADMGATLTNSFRLYNQGTSSEDVQTLAVTGSGFSLTLLNSLKLPVTLLPGAPLDFQISFSSATAGPAAGTLTFSFAPDGSASAPVTVSYPLFATAAPGPVAGPTPGGTPTPTPGPGATPTPPPGPVLGTVENGTPMTFAAGATIDFGNVQTGSSYTLSFTVQDQAASQVRVSCWGDGSFTVTPNSQALTLSCTNDASFTVTPDSSATAFTITFTPQTDGAAQPTSLQLNQSTFVLSGTGFEPQLPEPQIAINNQLVPNGQSILLASGEQATLAIQFAATPGASGGGEVSMQFQGAQDTAIGFLPPSSLPVRSATFNVTAGGDHALFDGYPYIAFQTGTTATTITFTATSGQYTEQASVVLPPAAIGVDAATWTIPAPINCTGVTAWVAGGNYTMSELVTYKGNEYQCTEESINAAPSSDPVDWPAGWSLVGACTSKAAKASELDFQLTGFDNTRSASTVTFTFHDSSGNILAGPFTVDESSLAFRQYFAASNDGGLFALDAVFPVSGDTARIASIEIDLTNSQGTTSKNVTIGE